LAVPFRKGERWFYTRNSGLQNQSVLYCDRLAQERAEVAAGPEYVVQGRHRIPDRLTSLSDDGQWLAYGTSSGGSDWNEIRIRHVETGEELPEVLQLDQVQRRLLGCTTAAASSTVATRSLKDGKSMTEKNKNKKVYFHKLAHAAGAGLPDLLEPCRT